MLSTEQIRKCPECGSSRLIVDYKRAEMHCEICGRVVEEKLPLEYNLSETGGNVNPIPQKGDDNIPPQVYFGRKDSTGKDIDQLSLQRLQRTARIYNLDPQERRELSMSARIRRYAAQLNIPEPVIRRAIEISKNKRLATRLLLKSQG